MKSCRLYHLQRRRCVSLFFLLISLGAFTIVVHGFLAPLPTWKNFHVSKSRKKLSRLLLVKNNCWTQPNDSFHANTGTILSCSAFSSSSDKDNDDVDRNDEDDELLAATRNNGDEYNKLDNEDVEEDDEDDEEVVQIKPYGNRSLAWTKRYRKLNPYEKVRNRVINNFGHRSKADWDECVANGWQGQYVPSRPDEMYAPEWVSWDEFLGIMRDYEDARNLAVNVLKLKSLDDYILFVRSDNKRAEGLRIPVRPDLYYKHKGWIDEATFFSKE